MRSLVALVVLALIGVPTLAQDTQETMALLSDDAGDVEVKLYDNAAAAPGSWGAVDLRSLAMTEDRDFIHVTVGIDAWPDCTGGTCVNAGDLRTHLEYNGAEYVVQQGVNLQGFTYAILNLQNGNSFQLTRMGFMDSERDEAAVTITAHIPRELLLDGSGAPPRKDASFTDIYTYSYSQFSLGGFNPDDPTGPPTDMLTTEDNMGFDAPATFLLALGGSDASGPVELDSPAPYRASNGGQATYQFALEAIFRGDGEPLFELEFEGVPDAWNVERPNGLLRLPTNTPAEFSILVETPFGHQHGGSESFVLRIRSIDNPDLWAETELGIHHLSIPQPSGHHPTMYFHSRATAAPFDVVSPVLGGTSGSLYANTLQEDEGDQGVDTQGWTSLPGQDRFRFAACLEPELLMGVDVNMTLEGLFAATFSSTVPLNDVVLQGRVLHLAPGAPINNCVHSIYQGREETIISTFGPSAPQSVGGSTTFELPVLPDAGGEYIPYASGALLVVEFEISPETIPGDTGPNGPLTLKMSPGGSITLPLDEYKDARPAGLVGLGAEAPAPAATPEADAFDQEPESKGSPAGFALVPVALLALLARRRR